MNGPHHPPLPSGFTLTGALPTEKNVYGLKSGLHVGFCIETRNTRLKITGLRPLHSIQSLRLFIAYCAC